MFISVVAVALSGACTTEQLTRTQQDRPTAPTQSVKTVNAANGAVPAGTEIAIRVNEAIDTETAGGVYRAEVAQDIQSPSGEMLIPRGAPAEVTVVQTESGGAVGTPEITLALRSITVNGRQQMASSATETAQGPEGLGTNRRTAEMVGGGAALGAVVGAIIGGGSGAATGAAIGAAGGAATQVLTKGDTVRIPAETVMNFRLGQPIQVS